MPDYSTIEQLCKELSVTLSELMDGEDAAEDSVRVYDDEQILDLLRRTGGLVLWMVVNTLMAARAFDPYPFILLNLVLSCIAAIQAPLIMMSQNRQEEKDRRRAENDYKVNLKTEIMIEDLYDKVNAILAKQSALEKQLQGKSKMDEQKPQ